jgi:hypothetical protein
MPFIVYVLAAIAVGGVIGLVLLVKNKEKYTQSSYAVGLTVCITLALCFGVVAILTGIFSR